MNAAQPPNPSPSSAKADHDRRRDETEIPFQSITIHRQHCLWILYLALAVFVLTIATIAPPPALSSRLLAGAGSPESTVV